MVCRHWVWKGVYHRALAGPWKSLNFFQIFKAWKVLENRHGLWKSLNLCLTESAWIRFSKPPWPNHLILKKVFQMAFFWPHMCIKSIFGRGFAPDPDGSWKSLNLILPNRQEPCYQLMGWNDLKSYDSGKGFQECLSHNCKLTLLFWEVTLMLLSYSPLCTQPRPRC